MKKFSLWLLLLLPLQVFAQEVQQQEIQSDSLTHTVSGLSEEKPRTTASLQPALRSPLYRPLENPFRMYGWSPAYPTPFSWDLHTGLNVSIGLTAVYSPDRYAPLGIGFGQDVTMLYAFPIGKRWSVAAGLYAGNLNWGGIRQRNIGVAGIAAYRINDRLTFYAYGNKSLTPKQNTFIYPYIYNPDRVGGMLNLDLGNHASISFGVHQINAPAGYFFY